MLDQVLGHRIALDDFVGNDGYITTSKLSQFTRDWCNRQRGMSAADRLGHYPPSASNSGMYYVRQLARRDVHDQCSKNMCSLNVIDRQSYVQRHCSMSSTTCDGSCPIISPSQDEVRAILVSGGLPLLKASTRRTALHSGPVELEVAEYQEGMEYTALSHIWSDGFGNPKSNSILGCQAAFLVQSIANTQEVDHGQALKDEVLFWIDTLLVPTGQVKNLDNAKNLALDKMLDTYQKASSILVLRIHLCQQNPSENLEAAAELMCSKWMRRLWTLQEGVLGSGRLHVLFKCGPVDVSRTLKDLNRARNDASWTEHALISFATRCGLSQVEGSAGRDGISWLVKDLNWRSTSVTTDEALVFANLTGQGSHALLQVPPAERMKTAVRLAKVWPSRTISAPGPRFHEEGYRWALKTFLSPSNFTFTGYVVEPPNLSPEKGLLGITVTYPGCIINDSISALDSFLLVDRQENRWLSVRRPLEPLHNSFSPRPFDRLDDDWGLQSFDSRRAGLVMFHTPWISKHSYGALVALAKFDNVCLEHEILSDTHQGAFDVLVTDLDAWPVLESRSHYSSPGMLKQQKWVIR